MAYSSALDGKQFAFRYSRWIARTVILFARFSSCILPWALVQPTTVCNRHRSQWQAGKVI